MNIAEVQDVAKTVISLLREYSGGHVGKREMLLDPILYGYLRGRFTKVSRQYYVHLHGGAKPHRIDFRHGGTNPVVIEFAVRSPNGGATLYGSQNASELRKLSRITLASARLRILLLIDLAGDSISQDRLKKTYNKLGTGPGKFTRRSVRIVYVHANDSYTFLWRP